MWVEFDQNYVNKVRILESGKRQICFGLYNLNIGKIINLGGTWKVSQAEKEIFFDYKGPTVRILWSEKKRGKVCIGL